MTFFNNMTLPNSLDTLATGRTSSNPFVVAFQPRDPTVNDINYPQQKIWLNSSTDNFWFLKTFNSVATGGVVQAVWIPWSSAAVIETLTGNDGIVVPPTGNNINVFGDLVGITTTGNAATSTLTIHLTGAVATQYTEDVGVAVPSGNNLNVFGSKGISTSGSGDTITISGNGQVPNYVNVTHAMSPYTVLADDFFISCDTTGGTVQLNFPNAPTFKQTWVVKDRLGNAAISNITITTPGGTVTIDGLTTYTMNSNYQAINLLANATPTYEVY